MSSSQVANDIPRTNATLTVVVSLGFFGLLPLAAVAGGLAIAPLIGLAGLLCMRLPYLRAYSTRLPVAVWLVLAFAAWAAASCLWSQYPNHSQALRLWATLAPGLVFVAAVRRDSTSRRWTRAAGVAAVCVLIVLVGSEALFNLPLNRAFDHGAPIWQIERNPGRGVSILLAMIWAVVAGLAAEGGLGRARLSLALLALTGALATQFEDYGNLAAFCVGLAGYVLGYWLPRLGTLLTTWGLAAWLLAAPFVTPLVATKQHVVDALPYSWAARVGIWRYVCDRIVAHPFFGSGMDASRAVTDTITVRDVTMRAVQLHPHSASLQIWFETGGVGALIGACALIVGGWTISRAVANHRAQGAAVCATFAALGLIANIGFGIWQEWWDATLLIGACLLLVMAPRPASSRASI